MNKKEYYAKLKDVRWQKTRLEVMQRDGFKCRRCHDDDETLNVHHCYYEWDNDPWNYPLSSLVTLCETCHAYETGATAETRRGLWEVFAGQGVLCDEINRFVSGVQWTLDAHRMSIVEIMGVLNEVLMDDEVWNAASAKIRAIREENTAFGDAVSDEFDAAEAATSEQE
jgi:hypothetical protein